MFRAVWIFPVDQPPIRDGVVETHAGQITAVRKYRPGDAVTDLGDVALVPGLVNPHTHLEFSEIIQPLGERGDDFPSWIRRVIAYRRERDAQVSSPGSWRAESIRAGLNESTQAAVAAVGEIATVPCSLDSYAATATHKTLFLELLGMAPERQDYLWQAAQEHIAKRANLPSGYQLGLSPHTPYTVQPDLIRQVCAFSRDANFPVAMHLAESIEEIELLQSGSGRLANFLQDLNALPVGILPRGVKPLWYLEMLAAASRSLVIHGNYLDQEEITFLAERSERMSVVYCPRTHAYFNDGDYPLATMLAANVNVCFGTDSRATNPNLNLWEEMCFAAERHPQVTPAGILHTGSLAAAEALGIQAEFGSITPGKRASLAIVDIANIQAEDPHELLFGSASSPQSLPSDHAAL